MQKSVSQQLLSCIKEGLEQQTSNKFETSEQFHPIPAFHNGGIELITKYEKDQMWKLDLTDAYLCVPLKKESRKYVWFQWEGTL